MIRTNSVIVYSPLCCSLYFEKIFKLFNLYNEFQQGKKIIALHSLTFIMYRTKREMVLIYLIVLHVLQKKESNKGLELN